MNVPSLLPAGRHLTVSLSIALTALLTACGGGGEGDAQSGVIGREALKESGALFIVDPNQTGGAADLSIGRDRASQGVHPVPSGVSFGRLVSIYDSQDVGTSTERAKSLIYSDFVIDPNQLSDGEDFVLDRDPATQGERLRIRHERPDGVLDPLVLQYTSDSRGDFERALGRVAALPSVAVKDDDGSSSAPFTVIPRNGCLVLRFDDCLDDSDPNSLVSQNLVNVLVGYPPTTPFFPRILYDPNHGGIVNGRFHSTRVLVDMTVSAAEAEGTSFATNAVGLPASVANAGLPNVSVRIPSRVDIGSSQFTILRNLRGASMDRAQNGPLDENSATLDIVRAMSSGGPGDTSNGFLIDTDQPRLLGEWPTSVSFTQDLSGEQGLDFLLDLAFDSQVCKDDLVRGELIQVPPAAEGESELFFTVQEDASLSGGQTVTGLHVRASSSTTASSGRTAFYLKPFDPNSTVSAACWATFSPRQTSGDPPGTDVETAAEIFLRFSEAMDPASVSAFTTFRVVNGGVATTPNSLNLVPGTVVADRTDLTRFKFAPALPFPHELGQATPLHVRIGNRTGPTGPSIELVDLAGGVLRHVANIPSIPFTIFANEPQQRNDAIVLAFDYLDGDLNDEYKAPDEAPNDDFDDLRGQFFFNTTLGTIKPRTMVTSSWPVDRTNAVPMAMISFTTGVFEPLNPLGAKLHTLWRYCDLNWSLYDETKYNLDVFGISWAPAGGLVVPDFFDQFEIRLGHSTFLPDEICCQGGLGGASGLPGNPAFFENNLVSPLNNPRVVHNRALGYIVNQAESFRSSSDTVMLPFPMNRGSGPITTFTWRDTAVEDVAGGGDPSQQGIPLQSEAVLNPTPGAGLLRDPGEIPTIGLPLLMEFKCYPSERGIGLNRFDVNIGSRAGAPTPGFRAYSAGGTNTQNLPEIVLPDSQPTPLGGFNPAGTPPGARTFFSADSIFYLGQLDTVTRISRVHTVWLDAGLLINPQWQQPVVESIEPSGTDILLDFRGVAGFTPIPEGSLGPFNAAGLDPYCNPARCAATASANQNCGWVRANYSLNNLSEWSSSIGLANNKRYLQVRITFVSNVTTGVIPELAGLAIPFKF